MMMTVYGQPTQRWSLHPANVTFDATAGPYTTMNSTRNTDSDSVTVQCLYLYRILSEREIGCRYPLHYG